MENNSKFNLEEILKGTTKKLKESFPEAQAKLDAWHRVNHGFVEVFSGFYEMRHAQDDIAVFRRFNFYGF